MSESETTTVPQYETHTLPNGQVVLYSDATHTYIVNGAEVPSITSLLPLLYGDTYGKVNPTILKAAAAYGTAVHGELQKYIDERIAARASGEPDPEMGVELMYPETAHYFTLIEPIWKITPIMTEKVVVLYGPNGMPVAAGRFDMLCKVGDKTTLVDFKTTSTIHRQLVSAQLNLYRKAAIQSGYFSSDDDVALGVIQLHKDTSKYAPLPVFADDFYLKFLI